MCLSAVRAVLLTPSGRTSQGNATKPATLMPLIAGYAVVLSPSCFQTSDAHALIAAVRLASSASPALRLEPPTKACGTAIVGLHVLAPARDLLAACRTSGGDLLDR